jgi:hypothetical protein
VPPIALVRAPSNNADRGFFFDAHVPRDGHLMLVRSGNNRGDRLIEIEEMAPAFALPKSTPVVTDYR